MALLALYAWVPIALCLFALLKPRHAVLASYIGAWLFLPIAGIQIKILPDITKVSVASYAVLLGALLFDPNRLLSFRPRWFDLPMGLWCALPFMSSVVNGLGWWDGCSAVLWQLVLWGIPYYIGRVYFNDWEGLRELAIGIFVGGLIYVPLCLFEIRMTPQLHRMVYGRHAHNFATTFRFGGYRPSVFMQSGLAVGFWMAATSLVGVWLWRSGSLKQLLGVPTGPLVAVLLATTVLCKSVASLAFLLAGLVALFWVRWAKNGLVLYLLIATAPLYIFLRTTGAWDAQNLVGLATAFVGEDRAQSLKTRIDAENLLTERAMNRPAFGHGRWDPKNPGKPAWRVYDENDKDIAVTDGMWVITLGTSGALALTAIVIALLMPALLLRRRVPLAYWSHPLAAPGAALAVMLVLHMLDNLLNAMLNPLFVLAVGGLTAVAGQAVAQQRAATPARTPTPYAPGARPAPAMPVVR